MCQNKCPFCDSKNIMLDQGYYGVQFNRLVMMNCNNCFAKIIAYGKTILEAEDRYNFIANKVTLGRR